MGPGDSQHCIPSAPASKEDACVACDLANKRVCTSYHVVEIMPHVVTDEADLAQQASDNEGSLRRDSTGLLSDYCAKQ